MAAVLASQNCCCRGLGFSSSFSTPLVERRQADLPTKFGTIGRAVKREPASKVVKRRAPWSNKTEFVNGSRRVINGASIGKRELTPLPVNIQTSDRTKDFEPLLPLEEFKVLPSDEGFNWASENYSSLQRSVDVWSFVLSLWIRVLFDNAKWAYAGGFTEDKQKARRRKTASWLRKSVLQLGLTFINLGQLSSTQSDLFPREFVDELMKLQGPCLLSGEGQSLYTEQTRSSSRFSLQGV